MFKKILSNYDENIAIINEEGVSFTYLDLDNFSKILKDLIPARSLVFCLCKNNIESLLGYFSFIKNKTVPLMLESSSDKELLEGLIEIYNPDYIWLPSSQISQFSNFKLFGSILGYSLLKLEPKRNFLLHIDLALLLTTSGSTGSPKLVRISYENIEANAVSIAEYLSITKNERPITTLPMSYSFGISIINSHFIKGATILLTSKSLMQKEFWDFLSNENATSMSGVPYTFEILKKLRFFKMNLPSLKTLTQAGGKLNFELNREFVEFCIQSNKRFYVMYGQTEATARMSYLPPEYSIKKLGSMGIAIPGGEFSLIDDSGNRIEGNGIVGELVYKGKNVSMGYAECRDDLQKGDENKGTLITGDLAKRDNDNFYYIVGRKKRFIKIFGNRVNLDETERLIKNKVQDCACAGEDDQMVIYIVDFSKKDEIRQYLSEKTGIHPSAFSIKHINSIPKNSAGKTIYSELNI